MDRKDREIIFILLKDARTPKLRVAEKLGVSETAVRKRIERLENQRILLGYRAVVDYKKTGFLASFTGIDVEPEQMWKVMNMLKDFKEIFNLYLTSGDHTILAEIITDSLDKMNEIHEKIAKISGVKRVCPAVILEVVK